jgi:hypothetical protein
MTKEEIFEFMARYKLGVLGSIAPDGTPQAALVGIAVTPGLEIVFDTLNTTRKYRNLIANPAASFVVGWEGEITVQFEGVAREPAGSEREHYRQAYFQAWPDGPSRLSWPGLTHLVVAPRWIRYSDFNQSPALVEEITFAG